MIVHDEICTPHTKHDLDIIEKQNKEIKSLRLILKSHGEIIEQNARLRELLKNATHFLDIEKFENYNHASPIHYWVKELKELRIIE